MVILYGLNAECGHFLNKTWDFPKAKKYQAELS